MPRYDAIVLGSGQAGNPLSQKMADHGWTVALVEKDHLGGTCVNTGCTPTKTLIASAQVAHYARHAARWGVRTGEVSVDLPRVVARKEQVVLQWRSGVERKVQERPGLHLYRGHGRFLDPHCVRIGEQVAVNLPDEGADGGRVQRIDTAAGGKQVAATQTRQ